MKKLVLTAASAIALLAAGSASAITYNITDTISIPNGGIGNPFVSNYETAFGVGDVGFGLVQSAAATAADTSVGFSFAFSSSGFANLFTFAGVGSIDEPAGVAPFTYTGGADIFTGSDMEFTVVTGSGTPAPTDAALGDVGFGIFYDLGGENDTVYLAFADRATAGDSDYSDHVIETTGTVNVVPLPAAAWMLLAGIGGLVSMRRRKS